MNSACRLLARVAGGLLALCLLAMLPAEATAQLRGACCLPTGHCVHTSEANCSAHAGTFHAGAHCSAITCTQPTGACCIPDGHGAFACSDLTRHDCMAASGHFAGPGTACATFQCPERGACCLPGGCVHTTEAMCTGHGGTFVGGACASANCPQPTGACCIPDGHGGFSCDDLTRHDCSVAGGHFAGAGTACATFQCPEPRGACCLPGGHCILSTESRCTVHGGTFVGGPCSSAGCPQPTGACCIADPTTGVFTCQDLTRHDCMAAHGHFRGPGTTCAVQACPPPRGACCLGTRCIMTFQLRCEHHEGNWQGAGVLCQPDPCGRDGGSGEFTLELIADFTGSGHVDITDALMFMHAYSAGNADLNGDGVTNTEDLMMFVRAFTEVTSR